VNTVWKQFLDKISERVFSLIGSNIGAAASTYHAVHQAEQQSLLEDLARRYESEGKEELADYLRRHAAQIPQGDPAREGQNILQQVLNAPTAPTKLLESTLQEADVEPPVRTRRRRRSAPTTTDLNQVDE
jgi:hypothetical protein